jgi:hypothetical protein
VEGNAAPLIAFLHYVDFRVSYVLENP